MRRLIDGLAPGDLEELGLTRTLQRRIRGHGAGEVRPMLMIDDVPALSPALEAAALHIVLEAYTNAVRHSRGTTCWISMRVDDELLIEVRDDGRGLCGSDGGAGVGLSSMRTRAAEVGGSLEVASAPEGGTVVRCTLPVAAP